MCLSPSGREGDSPRERLQPMNRLFLHGLLLAAEIFRVHEWTPRQGGVSRRPISPVAAALGVEVFPGHTAAEIIANVASPRGPRRRAGCMGGWRRGEASPRKKLSALAVRRLAAAFVSGVSLGRCRCFFIF